MILFARPRRNVAKTRMHTFSSIRFATSETKCRKLHRYPGPCLAEKITQLDSRINRAS